MKWLTAPRDGGYLISDLATYLDVSEERCKAIIEAAGVGLRVWCYDTGKLIYGSLSPDEAKRVIHFHRLRKGMRLSV